MIDAATFEANRRHLFGVAYRLLGTASDVDDVVQDAWLRVADAPDDVRHPQAYLTTVVTRLALDRLKAARTAREQYVGPWLPEPILTDEPAGPASVERSESVTMAFLVLLETLTPQERAVLLLRDVFDYDYPEIASALGTTEANCRQLLHRARRRVAERRPRFEPADEEHRRLVERFLTAVTTGEVDAIAGFLAAEASFTADGGGKAAAARRVVTGPQQIAQFFAGLWSVAQRRGLVLRTEMTTVNGEPALLLFDGDRLETVFVFSVAGRTIEAVRAIRNPDKLAFLQRQLAERGFKTADA